MVLNNPEPASGQTWAHNLDNVQLYVIDCDANRVAYVMNVGFVDVRHFEYRTEFLANYHYVSA